MVGELSGLSHGEVHVYFLRVEAALTQELREKCLGVLEPAERARYGRLLFERDRWPAIVGRGLLRHALTRYAEVEPSAWRFQDIGAGKPGLAGPAGAPSLTFNVTNTVGLAACAIALGRAVGVDAEPIGRRVDLASVALHCLADAERADVERLPLELQGPRILEYWTLKEAYVKAVGVGLGWPLDEVAFELGGSGDTRVRISPLLSNKAERWVFARVCPGDTHVLAVAAERDGGTPVIRFADAALLLSDVSVPDRERS